MNLSEIAEQVLAFSEVDYVLLSGDVTQVEAAVLTQMRRITARAVEQHLG